MGGVGKKVTLRIVNMRQKKYTLGTLFLRPLIPPLCLNKCLGISSLEEVVREPASVDTDQYNAEATFNSLTLKNLFHLEQLG